MSRSGAAGAAAMARSAAATQPAGSDLGAIDHVVFLMQENRSFDHYYGSLPRACGASTTTPRARSERSRRHGRAAASRTLLPFHLDSSTGIGECTTDLDHSWEGEHLSRGTGDNGAFVATHTRSEFEGPAQGVLTMGYYRRADLPFYYALADAFTICDNYHCSVLGPTHPNRLVSLSGTLDPAGHAGGPVLITNQSPDAVYSVGWDTMPEVLEDAGVSWKVYNPQGTIYAPAFFEKYGMTATDAVLPWFASTAIPARRCTRKRSCRCIPAIS